MTVVEIWPGGGWYTAILAPALRPHGRFYAAGFAMTAERTPAWRKQVQTAFAKTLASRPHVYDHVVVTELSVPERTTIAPPGSADMVLAFRLAAQAGLQLEARSGINANPCDGKEHPAGVWTLPPSLRFCGGIGEAMERERCRAKYTAIGESDRMTLRFRKQ